MNLTANHLEGLAAIIDIKEQIERLPLVQIELDEDGTIKEDRDLEKLEKLCREIQDTTKQYDLPLLSVYDHLINWEVDEANDGDDVPTEEIRDDITNYIFKFTDENENLTATEYIIHKVFMPDFSDYPTPKELFDALNDYNGQDEIARYNSLEEAKKDFELSYSVVDVFSRPGNKGTYYSCEAYNLEKCTSRIKTFLNNDISSDYEVLEVSAVPEYEICIADEDGHALFEGSPDEALNYLKTLGNSDDKYLKLFVNGYIYAESWEALEIASYVERMTESY